MATGGQEGDGSSGRRYKHNLQGLLQFSTEVTSPDPEHTVSPMDPERRKWLEEVIASMAGSDPTKLMLNDINIVLDEKESAEKKEVALQDLQELCEDLDNARDFYKMGGYNLVKQLQLSPVASLRWRSCELIGTCMQNNPPCQEGALKEEILTLMLTQVDTESDATARVKALYAVSCLTRDYLDGQEAFLERDGFSVLMRAMQADDVRLKVKAAFMLRAMCTSQPKFKDDLLKLGMVEQMIGLLQTEHSLAHEHMMAALLSLISDHDGNLAECKKYGEQLEHILNEREQLINGKDEFQEELQHLKKIRELVFTST